VWSPSPASGSAASDGRPWRDADNATSSALTFAQRAVSAVVQQSGATECGVCFQGISSLAPSSASHPTVPQALCCLSQQTRVPAISGGAFSVLRLSQETVADALAIWNPVCSDVLAPAAPQTTNQSISLATDDNGNADYINLLRGAVGDAVSGQ
jgi:hypothetical protein